MKRPAWAASPSFTNCWAALEEIVKYGSDDQRHKELSGFAFERLAEARVIVVSPEQVDALPSWDLSGRGTDDKQNLFDSFTESWSAMSLPFESMFLDMGGAKIPGGATIDGRDYELQAALLFSVEPGFFAVPFFRMDGRVRCGWGAVRPSPPSWAPFTDVAMPTEIKGGLEADFGDDAEAKYMYTQTLMSCRPAIAVLAWMESVNVEVVEVPLRAAQRARQIHKGRNISLTVQIKQSKRRAAASGGSSANLSHRFEVRGHYTHHFETKADGTPNKVFERYSKKHPEKVLNIQGQPCVRFWTPPYVKGPADKPFVPKVRVVQ